jgi:opacity protein-like surface antigen
LPTAGGEADAAFLPFVGLSATDNHWLRADINPQPEQGQGWGTQFEAIITYALTDDWSVGAGGRYWYFTSTTAHTQFSDSSTNSPFKIYSKRYGGFVQATYKFGGQPAAASAATPGPTAGPVTWSGFYVGGNLGAGFGHAAWSDPFAPSVFGDQVSMGGALAGGQIGANYQTGAIVYGVETAGSLARIEGTTTCFAGNVLQAIGGQNCGTTLGSLTTFTGRVGYAPDRTLYYVEAGPAYGHSTFTLNFGSAAPGQGATNAANQWGWTIGGGGEQALTDRWSIVADYKYVDLGSATIGFPGVPAGIAAAATEAISQRYQIVTLGVNYRFY